MITLLQRIEWFVALVLLQVLVLNRVHIQGYATPFLFIYFLFLLDSGTKRNTLLGWGFALGLAVDIFGNTPGMNAAAATLLACATRRTTLSRASARWACCPLRATWCWARCSSAPCFR
jgi:rod shape-determining protein MreD